MIGSGLFLSVADYRTLPAALQEGIEAWLAGRAGSGASAAPASLVAPHSNDETTAENDEAASEGVDLSSAQANKFLMGCGDKTKALLRAIFSKPTRRFDLGEITKEMNDVPLAGAWAGITKRVRTVLGDKTANLFGWSYQEGRDEYIGISSETTYRSMRRALGME